MYIRLFRDSGAAGGGGDNLGLSLSEIEQRIKEKAKSGQQYSTDPDRQQQQQQNDQQQQQQTDIKPGDGKDKVPDLKDKDQQQQQQDQQDKDKKPDDQQQQKDDDADPNKDADDQQQSDTDDPMAFWKSVDELTGTPIKVEYPEGVDPISPEGVVLRENAVREAAVDAWENDLREKYPRIWAYAMHHMSGGSDTEFMNAELGIALPERTKVEGDVALATTYYKNDLLSKGLDEDIVEAQVAKAVKDNKIIEKGLAVYDRVAKEQTDERDRVELRNKQENERVDSIMKGAIQRVEKSIPDLSFVVPDNRKAEFVKYVDDHMQINKQTGEVFLVHKLKDETVKAQLEALAFQFLGADLSKIVQKKVSTQAAQRLRQSADKTKNRQPADQQQQSQQQTFIPLGEMGGPKKK